MVVYVDAFAERLTAASLRRRVDLTLGRDWCDGGCDDDLRRALAPGPWPEIGGRPTYFACRACGRREVWGADWSWRGPVRAVAFSQWERVQMACSTECRYALDVSLGSSGSWRFTRP